MDPYQPTSAVTSPKSGSAVRSTVTTFCTPWWVQPVGMCAAGAAEPAAHGRCRAIQIRGDGAGARRRWPWPPTRFRWPRWWARRTVSSVGSRIWVRPQSTAPDSAGRVGDPLRPDTPHGAGTGRGREDAASRCHPRAAMSPASNSSASEGLATTITDDVSIQEPCGADERPVPNGPIRRLADESGGRDNDSPSRHRRYEGRDSTDTRPRDRLLESRYVSLVLRRQLETARPKCARYYDK